MKEKARFRFMEMKFYWRWHTSTDNGPRRVWRPDWGFDQFEIMSAEEFELFEAANKRFGIPMIEADDD